MLSFCLESQMGLAVIPAGNFGEAVDALLEENAIDLIVANDQPDTEKLFKYILSTGAQIPVIHLSNEPEKFVHSYSEIKLIGNLKTTELPESLVSCIGSNFTAILHSTIGEDYCRISTELLTRVVPLLGDIYIRLSSVKFVKLYRSGTVFGAEDLERVLVKKKLPYLYIKKTETQEFVHKFRQDLTALIAQAKTGDEGLFETVVEVTTLIQDLSQRLGFTQEVQDLVRQNIELTMKLIGDSPRLTKVLSVDTLRTKNYISSHSILLANISCSVAAQMGWPSNTTFQKLVLAALFHDSILLDPELAKISTKQDLEDKRATLSEEQLQMVKSHPLRCAELVKTINEIPGDVSSIVAQHHERPDGSGFPKGLRGHQLAPLAAVFIVGHDLLDSLAKDRQNFSMANFLNKHEAEYQIGTFRKIWKCLKPLEADEETAQAAPSQKIA